MSHTHDRGPLADASVRRAAESDAPAVGLVQVAVWREAYAGVLPPEVLGGLAVEDFTRAWRPSLASPPSSAHWVLVACAGDQVVGFAATAPSADPDATDGAAELVVGGVHPQGRRAGHGSRLLNATVDTARGAGFTTLRTWVLARDEATRSFLTAAGFAPDGAHRNRVVGPQDEELASEVRLTTSLG